MEKENTVSEPEDKDEGREDENKLQKREGEDEGRPPVDPKNKLYTVISLLIFAVLYIGYGYIKENFTLCYSLFYESPAAEDVQTLENELGISDMPEGSRLLYARIHVNFDDSALYCTYSLPEEITCPEDFEDYIPYTYGDVTRDERYTIFPYEEPSPEYVFGDCYVFTENPKISCLVYETDNGFNAVFRTVSKDAAVRAVMKKGVKIPVR